VQPLVLVVCDGWGHNPDPFGNAILAADTPVMDRLCTRWPNTTVAASGEAVGLPPGQQGNSEVGHLTIGAGRVIFQDLPRIARDITTGAFFDNPVLVAAAERARDGGGTLHCMGLVSPGGVHSHQDHALALAELGLRRGLDRIVFHAFTDGRDEPPTSAAEYVAEFEAGLARIGVGRIATVSGRFWAMDRDRRWDRTARAYGVMVEDDPQPRAASAVEHIRDCYAQGITDEFVIPAAIVTEAGERTRIDDGDTVIFFNFRPDRARQLCHALVDADFAGFVRHRHPERLRLATFSEYEAGLTDAVAFPKQDVADTLCEVVSRHGLAQFHVAETEKYAHVTYFINGGREVPFEGEERLLVPSPKVATYDTVPEMSAAPITDAVVERLRRGGAALVVVNFANPDMVGHTGDFDATVIAVSCVDHCIGRIVDAALEAGGAALITADHGNAELKIDRRDGSRLTAHTTSPVPVVVCGAEGGPLRSGGGLADVAPTVLGLLGLPVPGAMTGRDLREAEPAR